MAKLKSPGKRLKDDPAFRAGMEVGKDSMVLVVGLAREGERAAVVVGAARLDLALEQLLKRVMQHHPGGSDNLFDADRPLGTFMSKIALAYRLKLVDRDVELALQLVRKIRNEFAHSVGAASLSDASHASRLRELSNHCRASIFYDERGLRRVLSNSAPKEELVVFSASLLALIASIERAAYFVRPFAVPFPASFTRNAPEAEAAPLQAPIATSAKPN